MLGLAMCLTSCEGTLDDIFGEWSRPTGNNGNTKTTVAVKSVTLDETTLRKAVGDDAVTLTATVDPSDASDKTVTWKSSDETVATVDASGKVTPTKAGTTTITATANDGSGKKATSTVYVYDKIVDISTDTSVDAGASWLINGTGTTEDHSITIANNSKVTLNGLNITGRINCTDNATIILADGSANTVTAPTGKAGIIIGPSKTLTIDAETAGTGILNATGGDGGAGIGTNKNETGGNIVINGGRVTATGGDLAAGIGTGKASDTSNTCGDITINGGMVTATGGYNYGAGIGTGYAVYATNTCDAITINGGTVTATGGIYGAGIGTGLTEGDTNTCGAITIKANVTSVTATKGDDSPNSIGNGFNDSGTQNCGTITFGTAEVYNGGGDWTTYNSMTAGTYGGLTLAISGKTWTLTPSN